MVKIRLLQKHIVFFKQVVSEKEVAYISLNLLRQWVLLSI